MYMAEIAELGLGAIAVCEFYFQHFHKEGRIVKTTHEGKTRKCTSCDTSIQPGVH